MRFLLMILVLVGIVFAIFKFTEPGDSGGNTGLIYPDYNGIWDVSLTPTTGTQCSTSQSQVTVANGNLSGVLQSSDGLKMQFTAIIRKNGKIQGNPNSTLGSFEGDIIGGTGKGVWADKYGCAGVFTMIRNDGPVNTNGLTAPKAPSNEPSL